MKLYNLKDHNEQVSFAQAVTQGLGKNQGLFFPHDLPEFSLTEIDEMLKLDFVTRSAKILSAFIGDEIPQEILEERVRAAFAFPAPVANVESDVGCLELFHGPTLAFKDFGGRFMAQMLTHIAGDKPVTILTATSGDTGAAVAHAFYGLPNVKVVILYPRGKISPLQEKLFCTLGGNIETVAIDGDFDACQALVKQAFDDEELKVALGLNSANSINISRLLAQICYYFEAVAQLPQEARNQLGCLGAKRKLRRFDGGSAGEVTRSAGETFYCCDQRERYRATFPARRSVVTQSDSGDVIQRDGRESAEQLAACGRVVPPQNLATERAGLCSRG